MNANELADSLYAASSEMEYNYVVSDWKLLADAATMLRQLQAENEALKVKAHEWYLIAMEKAQEK